MSADQLGEANIQLTRPPLVGLALSRSLGFIVIGRLAQRFGVSVKLTASPSGGVTALVTLPRELVTYADEPALEEPPPTEAAARSGRGRPAVDVIEPDVEAEPEAYAPPVEPVAETPVADLPAPPVASPSRSSTPPWSRNRSLGREATVEDGLLVEERRRKDRGRRRPRGRRRHGRADGDGGPSGLRWDPERRAARRAARRGRPRGRRVRARPAVAGRRRARPGPIEPAPAGAVAHRSQTTPCRAPSAGSPSRSPRLPPPSPSPSRPPPVRAQRPRRSSRGRSGRQDGRRVDRCRPGQAHPEEALGRSRGGGMPTVAASRTASGQANRSPEEVRKMLSRYRSGLNKGRGDADSEDQ